MSQEWPSLQPDWPIQLAVQPLGWHAIMKVKTAQRANQLFPMRATQGCSKFRYMHALLRTLGVTSTDACVRCVGWKDNGL